MTRWLRAFLILGASIAVAGLAAACGTENISVPKSQTSLYAGAVLFQQRCAGCHTLNYAATHGSAPNPRIAQANNGPNFNVRCERPVARVLYAIENGGFSGAYMPQNIVVGQDAIEVAKFVSTYAGRLAPKLTGLVRCDKVPIGTLPSATAVAQASTTSSAISSAAKPPKKSAAKKHKRTHA